MAFGQGHHHPAFAVGAGDVAGDGGCVAQGAGFEVGAAYVGAFALLHGAVEADDGHGGDELGHGKRSQLAEARSSLSLLAWTQPSSQPQPRSAVLAKLPIPIPPAHSVAKYARGDLYSRAFATNRQSSQKAQAGQHHAAVQSAMDILDLSAQVLQKIGIAVHAPT